MKVRNLLGVKRGNQFSPNHIGNDEMIFNLTASELEKKGFNIKLCSEHEFFAMEEVPFEGIFTMARDKKVVARLQQIENNGLKVCNSAKGIENCFRTNMTVKLTSNDIPYPKSNIVLTSRPGRESFKNLHSAGYWIKRGDFHAINKEDVTFVENEDHGRYILNEFRLRGIKDAVISEHLKGDLVKFYGVRGTDFFHVFYPYAENHHKYPEYELINGKTSYYPFDPEILKSTADRAAVALNIHVYGGDAIVDSSGKFSIIDFNDWPSFAPCRTEASLHIASTLADVFDK